MSNFFGGLDYVAMLGEQRKRRTPINLSVKPKKAAPVIAGRHRPVTFDIRE